MPIAMMIALTDTLVLVTALSGAVCLLTWPLFETRVTMLTVQLGIAVSFGLHYTLLGADTAAVGNSIGALQILASLLFSNVARLQWVSYAPIPLMLAFGVLTWDGANSLFATIGTIILALGRAQQDESQLRTLVLIGTGCWLVHDILVWSPIAIVDAISLVVGCLASLRTQAATVATPMLPDASHVRDRRVTPRGS